MNPPLILAHRGARRYAPENTISAFKKVIELKLDGVEFDVQSTSDGLPVVIHDDNLHKLTGRHLHLHKTPYVDIINLDAGRQFSPYFSGEGIPTFKDVLAVFKGTGMLLNVELKSQARQNKNFVPRVIETIKDAGLESQVLVSSFSRELLYKVGRAAPYLKRSLLLRPRAFFFLDVLFSATILAVCGINPHISILNKYLMRYANARGMNVMTWAANEPYEIRKAIKLGVLGIITDEPLLAKEIIKEIYG